MKLNSLFLVFFLGGGGLGIITPAANAQRTPVTPGRPMIFWRLNGTMLTNSTEPTNSTFGRPPVLPGRPITFPRLNGTLGGNGTEEERPRSTPTSTPTPGPVKVGGPKKPW